MLEGVWGQSGYSGSVANFDVIHSVIVFMHQLLQIAVAERIGDVPAYALQYDILLALLQI